jgi:hypothetical protein
MDNGERERRLAVSGVPPMPERAPTAGRVPLAEWLRMPRPADAPLGVWRAGYVPRPETEPEQTPAARLAVGALASAFVGWVVWSLLYNGYLGSYWIWPLTAATPDSWRGTMAFVVAAWAYYALVAGGLAVVFGRLGQWPEAARRLWAWARRRHQTTAAGAQGAVPRPRTALPAPEDDPAAWCELRREGAVAEAEQLTRELHAGGVSDVDHARITHAWRTARSDAARQQLLEELRARGAAAAVHGSGARDLPGRAGQHDLVLRQVRLGSAVDIPRNPYPYRTASFALAPEQLATGLLTIGPSGSGKTSRIVRPVVEALSLQALAGQAAVVVVTDRGEACVPSSWCDVVIGPGAGRGNALDLFGGTQDPDEAAAIAAEALTGDLEALGGRAAVTLLAQLIGPYRAVHSRWPRVEELRDLLDGGVALEELRGELEAKGLRREVRELAAGARQVTGNSAIVAQLADRVAVLDRPALADLVTTDAGVTVLDRLDKPVRVRVDLPARVHHEAARILTRLVLAKYAAAAPHRAPGSPFACLVLDDATGAITPQSVQALQRLRSAQAGLVLALRALSDVPEQLRAPLVGAVGCRAVCAGIGPWDGQHVATAWGTEWVEEVSVTDRQLIGDEPVQKLMYGLRKLATGRHVTAQSVTTRRERRQRWPAEDLATEIPGGHAVISITDTAGERSSPILIRLSE